MPNSIRILVELIEQNHHVHRTPTILGARGGQCVPVFVEPTIDPSKLSAGVALEDGDCWRSRLVTMFYQRVMALYTECTSRRDLEESNLKKIVKAFRNTDARRGWGRGTRLASQFSPGDRLKADACVGLAARKVIGYKARVTSVIG